MDEAIHGVLVSSAAPASAIWRARRAGGCVDHEACEFGEFPACAAPRPQHFTRVGAAGVSSCSGRFRMAPVRHTMRSWRVLPDSCPVQTAIIQAWTGIHETAYKTLTSTWCGPNRCPFGHWAGWTSSRRPSDRGTCTAISTQIRLSETLTNDQTLAVTDDICEGAPLVKWARCRQ